MALKEPLLPLMQDWTQAVRRPPAYLVNRPWLPANSWNSRNLIRFLSLTLLALFLILIVMLCAVPNQRICPTLNGHLPIIRSSYYNSTYPLSSTVVSDNGDYILKIALITDLDEDSKVLNASNTWFSYLRYGWLHLTPDYKAAALKWHNMDTILLSKISAGGRGMELSDLKVFDGNLLTADDRTGIIYRIEHLESKDTNAVPWIILANGAGNTSDPLKVEWMTVKDRWLYIGGLGKEWTTSSGELVNFNPMWVKMVSPSGEVNHIDWHDIYVDLRKAAGISYPGYMVHESAQWSEYHRRWFFLPRRASKSKYDENDDEKRGTNLMIVADESFKQIEVRKVGPLIATHGFSAFQFIPGTKDTLILALKSEENEGTVSTYITLFDVWGNVILKEEKLNGNYKFEGLEFV